uniref:COesterase domain-containing protein n=1 Tax=Caenorhabditis japonica TaxID=281687 RepID=A0A8R1DJH4_CAEJA
MLDFKLDRKQTLIMSQATLFALQMPQPHPKWTEVKETKAFGPRGVQKDSLLIPKIAPQSEDNLTLNIFTPVWKPKNEKGFAVLFYIHGGGFVSDSAHKYGDLSISKHLVTKDVVVVTIQYRLGFLGFWTTGDDTIPDNLAFHDMTFALRWVKENIHLFNGDADNITLMGQSAGGASVDFMSISPVSRDLFHKVIPMGGNASCNWAIHSSPLLSCRNHAHGIGVGDEMDSLDWIEKLRQVPADKFGSALEINGDTIKNPELVIGPKYDSIFLPKSIKELRSESPVKPRLVGCAKSEGLIMCLTGMGSKQPIHKVQDSISVILSERLFPLKAREYQEMAIEKLIDVGTEHSKEEWQRAICELKGDSFLNVGVQKNVLDVLEAAPQTPIFLYSFDYYNPKAYGILGWKLPFKDATHCTDISYVVGNHIVMPLDFNEDDYKMIEITTRFWTNFAKYGDPNGEGADADAVESEQKWEPATQENPQTHLSLSLQPTLHQEYKQGRPLFLAQLLREAYQPPNL